MGQGVLQDVSGRLVRTFAQNLAAMLEGGRAEPSAVPPTGPPPAGDALDLGSLGGAMVTERLRDPRVLGAVLAAVALIAYLLGRRR